MPGCRQRGCEVDVVSGCEQTGMHVKLETPQISKSVVDGVAAQPLTTNGIRYTAKLMFKFEHTRERELRY